MEEENKSKEIEETTKPISKEPNGIDKPIEETKKGETQETNAEDTSTKGSTEKDIKETKELNTGEESKDTKENTKESNEIDKTNTKEETKDTKEESKSTGKKEPKKGYGVNGNLIANKDRTPSELREMTRNGGIASGIARRQKKALNEYGKMWLDMKPTTKEMELLESQGVADERDEMTRGAVLTLVLYREAVKGNMRAIEKFFQIEKEVAIKEESKTTDFIGALNITAKEVWSDNSGEEPQKTESIKEPKGGGDNAT